MPLTSGTRPKISVIVPCFNHADFLEQRLSSIANQTFSDIEIILLDDASSDKSVEILEQFKRSDNRVSRVEVNQHNSGAANSQWLKGIQYAKGEYVWIAESDDVAAPDLLEKLIAPFMLHPNLGLSYCKSIVIDEQGNELAPYDYRHIHYPDIWQHDFVMPGSEFCATYLVFRNVIPNVSAVLFKTENLREGLKLQNSFKYCADWLVYFEVLAQCDISYINQGLNYFRQHSSTTRWHNPASYYAELKEKMGLFRHLKQHPAFTDQTNLQQSIGHCFTNRHKQKHVDRVLASMHQSLTLESNIAIWGMNDIAMKIISEVKGKLNIVKVFDQHKCGLHWQGVDVCSPNVQNLKNIDTVVIASLRYKALMIKELKQFNFLGTILAV